VCICLTSVVGGSSIRVEPERVWQGRGRTSPVQPTLDPGYKTLQFVCIIGLRHICVLSYTVAYNLVFVYYISPRHFTATFLHDLSREHYSTTFHHEISQRHFTTTFLHEISPEHFSMTFQHVFFARHWTKIQI